MAKSKKAPKRKPTLAAFLRKLWSKPDLMERFSQSREGRAQVIRESNLSARHAKLLQDGCVRDIVAELAGVKTMQGATDSTVVNCERNQADVSCGHPECESFMKAAVKDVLPKKKR